MKDNKKKADSSRNNSMDVNIHRNIVKTTSSFFGCKDTMAGWQKLLFCVLLDPYPLNLGEALLSVLFFSV